MEKIKYEKDRILLLAQYENPQMHRHFSKHILVSEQPFLCKTKACEQMIKSAVIQSNIWHAVTRRQDAKMLVFLIDEKSNLSHAIDESYLGEKDIVCLPQKVENGMIECLKHEDCLTQADRYLLAQLSVQETAQMPIDPRIFEVTQLVEACESIDKSMYDTVPQRLFLSKSRFLHLFKQQMGIDFKNYLLLKKLEKTYRYVVEKGMTLTDGAILAGFSSASHFSSACKNHYGISFTDFLKAQREDSV